MFPKISCPPTGGIDKSRVIIGFLFDLIFPIECLRCGIHGEWLCADCHEHNLFVDWSRVYLPFCPHVDELWHVADFNDQLVSKLVRTAKYQGVSDISILMGRLVSGALMISPQAKLWHGIECVPIPLYPTRFRMRGFNQAELIANEVAYVLAVETSKRLKKIRNTKPQAKLTGEARRLNLQGAFVIENLNELPETVILIDDVLTTGATFEEGARVLKEAGVKRVIGLAFGHGV